MDDCDNQDKNLDDVLRLMEKSGQNDEKPWEALDDADNQKLCRDLMDVRFAMHERLAAERLDVNAELKRFKEKQNRKGYIRMLCVWSASVAAIMIGVFLVFDHLYDVPVVPKEVTVFAADTTSQQVVLAMNDGNRVVLEDDNHPEKQNQVLETPHLLDYTTQNPEVATITRKMLQTHTITIPRGKTFKLVLADGTEVWLNANSKLIYPTEFIEKERSVFLEGEAYFKVTKNAKPFIVKTNYVQTRVLGTEFNVRSYQADDVHVTLVSGKVRVSNADNTCTVNLNPGKDAILRDDGRFDTEDVDSDKYTYWKDGYFYFDQLPLVEIMQSVGSWYNVNVVFRNKEAMRYRMHFMSSRDGDISETIRLMNRLKKVTLTLHEGTLYVD
ncbi:MAG: FecR family protein [Bacteroides sp.]|nr:FecR family protein [Bacteroides sp.]